MAYGQGEYGHRGFGGSSFEPQGPQLTASEPANGATNVLGSAPLSFTVESASGLDINTLRVLLNGTLIVLAEDFQPGYTGTQAQETEPELTITFASHPSFDAGSNQVDIFITDLAGNAATLGFVFSSEILVGVADSVSVTEDLDIDDSPNLGESVPVGESLVVSASESVILSEQVGVTETITTGSFDIFNIDKETFQVTTPFDFHFDNALDLSNYTLVPDPEGNSPGNPLAIKGITLLYTIYQTGSSGAVIPEEPTPGAVDLKDGRSDIFQFSGNITSLFNLGDFIFLRDGVNAGLYQILEVIDQGPAFATVRFDKTMSLMYSEHGVTNSDELVLADVTDRVAELATSETELVFQIDHPLLTSSNPLKRVYALEQNARSGDPLLEPMNATSALPAEIEGSLVEAGSVDLTQIEILDYQTFKVPNIGQPIIRGTDASDVSTSAETYLVVFQTESGVAWTHLSGVQGAKFSTSKMRDGGDYLFQARNLYTKLPRNPYISDVFSFRAQGIEGPRLLDLNLDEEGVVQVLFNEDMRQEEETLTNPADYSITGPSTVHVRQVQSVGSRGVALYTEGLSDGDYTLEVSTATPKDAAGNPLNPIYNSAVFTSSTPIRNRSIFTDLGPLAKPELSIQAGTAATIDSISNITLTGAVLTNDDIGKRVRLASSGSNDDDTYKILSVVDTDTVRVQARLNYPDANSGAIDWEVYDPRNGMVADDPADVTVRVNGSVVTPDAVIGLRGQIVLPSVPDEDDVVDVDYCHICNPRVEIRRLNSKEFRLNAWNRNVRTDQETHHAYRFNNVLITPSNYTPNDIQATLPSPLLRGLKYRGYERAYTATLNDPTRLLLNTPTHKIAYPPPSRPLSEVSVFYEGDVLPENDSNPWTRKGSGTAVVAAGNLTVMDDSTGPAPTGQGLFWTQPIDVSYNHVFSAAWRFSVTSVTTYEGVWSGIAAGYSDEILAYVVGYLEEGGVKKIGFLKRDAEENVEDPAAWIGGVDTGDTPTGAAADFDWSVLHSYRIFRSQDGTVRLFVDGDVVETLRVTPDECPFLEELNGPFDDVQGIFFGSLSRPAESTSVWDFYRYLSQPINTTQTSPSSFVSYEANVLPELDSSPWTPIGFHGTSSLLNAEFLRVDSTSASDSSQGLIGGDFRGYVKLEPLLSSASQVSVDFAPRLLTHTHDVDPNGLMLAVDDGNRVMQVSFLSDTPAPKISYGGRTFPEDFTPSTWTALGTQPSAMLGRYLQILDASDSDGLVYFSEDTEPTISDTRVIASGIDYIAESRLKVNSYTPDAGGFCGAFTQIYDSTRSVGFMLLEDAGTRYITLHSEGIELGLAARFAFEWGDGAFHTYRLRKDTGGNLVTLFVDGVLLGSAAYSDFSTPPADPVGQISFGSSTASSTQSESDVEWAYCNAWRVSASEKRYVGLWKGTTDNDFTDYHLPLKTSGNNASVQGNTLNDPLATFISDNVLSGDLLVVDVGANKGSYEVVNVNSGTNLTIVGTWPSGPTLIEYRVVRQIDWAATHKYRLTRDSTGTVSLFLDTDSDPIVQVGYNPLELPVSGTGLVNQVANGIAAIAFGPLSSEELSQSLWDYVRYGITRAPTEDRIVPPNHVLNQWNVMESPERLFTTLPHDLTDFKSSSTGVTPNFDPDFLERGDVTAHTQLNQGTPLVPKTQSFENRGPYATQSFVSVLNNPEDTLNNDGDFVLNDGSLRVTFDVPDDVLYTCLQVIEETEGSSNLLRPFDDDCGPEFGNLQYQREVCLNYAGDVLPEDDPAAITPWTQVADDPGEVVKNAFSSILTYGTSATGTRTAYLNNTPLPDAPSLQTEVKFRLRLSQDTTLGTGDSQVRFGLSAPGMTIGLGFVTTALGERFVQVFDLNNGNVLGYATFDYLDGNFHEYRIVRIPGPDTVQIFIDS